MSLFSTALELRWQEVPQRAIALAEQHTELAHKIAEAIAPLSGLDSFEIWYEPKTGSLNLTMPNCPEGTRNSEPWMKALHKIGRQDIGTPEKYQRLWEGDLQRKSDDDLPWIKIAFRSEPIDFALEKQATSSALRGWGEATGLLEGPVSKLMGGPNPMVGALAGGLLGSGLGYGAGWLGEHALPQSWQRGHLRRTGAVLGGMAGAAPAMGVMFGNHMAGLPWNDKDFVRQPEDTPDKYFPTINGQPNPTYNPNMPSVPKSMSYKDACDLDFVYSPEESWSYKDALAAIPGELPPIVKEAVSGTGDEYIDPPIYVDALNQSMWADPRTSQRLSPAVRAATSGLIESAFHDRTQREQTEDGGARLVWPGDIARVAAGMGSGYFSGAVVGKVLGTLLGLPEPLQDKLKTTGLWAGAIANVVPLVFRGH